MRPVVLFYHSASPYSNWYPARFAIPDEDGALVVYGCVEQRMMHAKALLFGDDDAAAAIMRSSSPAAQKKVGRRVRGFDERRWAQARYDVVLEAVRAKFDQNPSLREALLSEPRDALFAEASPRDKIWGIGLAASSPGAADPARWKGANLLGTAITAVRDELALRAAAEPALASSGEDSGPAPSLSDADVDALLGLY